MHTSCISPGRERVNGQTRKSPKTATFWFILLSMDSGTLRYPAAENRCSEMPSTRRVLTLQRRSAGDPLYIDSLPRTVKQLPINCGCSRHDFSFVSGARDCAHMPLLKVRRNRITKRM